LRVRSINAEATEVFGDINQDQIVAGVARIVKINDDDIRRLVNDTMGDDAGDFANILIARKNVLAKKYEKELAKLNKVDEIPPQGNITKVEIDNIEKSNINGYSIATDKNEIEDQLVHFYNYFDVNKTKKLGSYLKIRGAAANKLDNMTLAANFTDAQKIAINFDEVNGSILENLKGLKSRFEKGADFDDKSVTRIVNFRKKLLALRREAKDAIADGKLDPQDFDKVDKALSAYAKDFNKILDENEVGKKIKKPNFNEEKFTNFQSILRKKSVKKQDDLVWRKEQSVFPLRNFEDGVGTDTGKYYTWSEDMVHVTEIDGITVKYWRSDTNTAIKNRLELFSDGGAITANQHLNVMQKLGINSNKASIADREELYLIRTLYQQSAKRGRGLNWWEKRLEKINELKTQSAKVDYLRKEVSMAAGVDDITVLPTYKPLGEWQALGNGRIHTYRPDAFGDEWNKFYDEHIIYHKLHGNFLDDLDNILSSGGQMAPTVDKLRRGIRIGGASPEADIRTGGASYFFTRIQKKSTEFSKAGLVWDSRIIGRLDSISYKDDEWGRTVLRGFEKSKNPSAQFVLNKRGIDPKAFREFSEQGGNETNFKDSLSLFDNLKYIVANTIDDREEILNLLKNKYKLKKWPDGRRIEDVVVWSGG